jgi:hypothetical protein
MVCGITKTAPFLGQFLFGRFAVGRSETIFVIWYTLHNFLFKSLSILPVDKLPKVWYYVSVIKGQDPNRKEINTMNNYLCEDLENGGYFFVQCDSIEEAEEILEENGFDLEQVDFLDVVDDETAEIYGYDTY